MNYSMKNFSRARIYWASALILALGIMIGTELVIAQSRAQETAPGVSEAPARAASAPRIDIDEQAKAFFFIIDGKPIARLDKDGLEVIGDISYGGVLTDAGAEWVKQKLTAPEMEAGGPASPEKEAAHE